MTSSNALLYLTKSPKSTSIPLKARNGQTITEKSEEERGEIKSSWLETQPPASQSEFAGGMKYFPYQLGHLLFIPSESDDTGKEKECR